MIVARVCCLAAGGWGGVDRRSALLNSSHWHREYVQPFTGLALHLFLTSNHFCSHYIIRSFTLILRYLDHEVVWWIASCCCCCRQNWWLIISGPFEVQWRENEVIMLLVQWNWCHWCVNLGGTLNYLRHWFACDYVKYTNVYFFPIQQWQTV